MGTVGGRCFGLFTRPDPLSPFFCLCPPFPHIPQTQQQVVWASQLLPIKVIAPTLPDLGAQEQCLVLDLSAIPFPSAIGLYLSGCARPVDLIKEIKGPFPPGHVCPCLSLQAQENSRVTPGQGQRWDSGGDMEEPPWSVVAYSQARPVPLMEPWLLR